MLAFIFYRNIYLQIMNMLIINLNKVQEKIKYKFKILN